VDYFINHEDYANQKGDICRYLGVINPSTPLAGYRLPTIQELLYGVNKGTTGAAMPIDWSNPGPTVGYWTRTAIWANLIGVIDAEPDGTSEINSGAYFSDVAYFPTSMARNYSDGNVYSGFGGYYWTCSRSNNYFYDLNIAATLATDEATRGEYGESVRCVKDE
jgi:hypothetical protein